MARASRLAFSVTCLLVGLCAPAANATPIPLFLPYPKIDTGHWYISHGWANSDIQSCEWRKEAITARDNNIVMTLSDKGGKVRPISCAEMQSEARHGYGSYSTRMRAAKGSGLNTAFFTFIGPAQNVPHHDEIDFEFLGKDTTMVQLNYYIDGKPQGATFVKLGYDASKEFHDYTFVWEPKKIRWYIDNKLVRETDDNVPIPTHPGKIFLTLWSGSPKVKDWLGPFEYKEDADAEFSWVKYTPLH